MKTLSLFKLFIREIGGNIFKLFRKIAKKSKNLKNINAKKGTPYFVSKNREKLFGDDAIGALKVQNDSKYYNPEKGVVAIDKSRWLDAQQAEKNVWLRDFKNLNSDANQLKRSNFDDYEFIKGMNFTNAIELGCGPFTNLRYIMKLITSKNIHLLDPLLNNYLKKDNCAYQKVEGGGYVNLRRK